MNTPTKIIDVVVGVLRNAHGEYLFAQRPEGKPMAGYWEFPGGKVEVGETHFQALQRELIEELGIRIDNCIAWKVTEHDYPHALVRLHWCKVFEWQGEFEMREGQTMSWQAWTPQVKPILPGAYPVLEWLAEERGEAFDPAMLG